MGFSVVLERYEVNSSVFSSYLQVCGFPTPLLIVAKLSRFFMCTFYLNFEGLLTLQLTDSLLRMACSFVTIITHARANSSHCGMETVLVTKPAEMRFCNSS